MSKSTGQLLRETINNVVGVSMVDGEVIIGLENPNFLETMHWLCTFAIADKDDDFQSGDLLQHGIVVGETIHVMVNGCRVPKSMRIAFMRSDGRFVGKRFPVI